LLHEIETKNKKDCVFLIKVILHSMSLICLILGISLIIHSITLYNSNKYYDGICKIKKRELIVQKCMTSDINSIYTCRHYKMLVVINNKEKKHVIFTKNYRYENELIHRYSKYVAGSSHNCYYSSNKKNIIFDIDYNNPDNYFILGVIMFSIGLPTFIYCFKKC
jgi:hypothetical protein